MDLKFIDYIIKFPLMSFISCMFSISIVFLYDKLIFKNKYIDKAEAERMINKKNKYIDDKFKQVDHKLGEILDAIRLIEGALFFKGIIKPDSVPDNNM